MNVCGYILSEYLVRVLTESENKSSIGVRSNNMIHNSSINTIRKLQFLEPSQQLPDCFALVYKTVKTVIYAWVINFKNFPMV